MAEEKLRTVASKHASSGMMLRLVPAWNTPTVSTTGSNTSNRRVTMVCSAVTISAATGIGSSVWCGVEPCPPAPTTRTNSPAEAAISGPGRDEKTPRSRSRGEHVQPVRGVDGSAGGGQHPLGDHVAGPVEALFAGLEHEDHVTGEVRASGAEQLGGADQAGGVQVVAAGVHHPVVPGGVVQPGALGDRQGVHVAAEQYRRAGPGAAQHRGDRGDLGAGADLQRQRGERGEHPFLGPGQVQADLRDLVQLPAERGQLVLQGGGVLAQAHLLPIPLPAGHRSDR